MKLRPTPYGYPEVHVLVSRLAETAITDAKVEFLARRVHELTGWAGTPISWDDWTEESRERSRQHAREVLEEIRALHDD